MQPDIASQSFPSHGIWWYMIYLHMPSYLDMNSVLKPRWYMCMLWLKLLNHTMEFFVGSNNFTWRESYCEKNQSRTLKPFFLLSTTPPFILITTFWGRQYPFKYTKAETFPCCFTIGARQIILRVDPFTHIPYTSLHPKIHTKEPVRLMQVR